MLDRLWAAVTAEGADPKEILLNCTRLAESGSQEDCRLAEAAARRAAAALPGDHDAATSMAYVLECLGKQYIGEATHIYREAGEATGAYGPWGQYVWAERGMINSDRAVRTLHARITSHPDDAGARRALIRALLYADQADDALAAADVALARRPEDPALHDGRGDILARLGRAAEAEAEWRRALDLDPRYVGARYTLAFAYENRGDPQTALTEWREILAFLLREFPDDPAYIWAQDNVRRLGG